MRKKKPGELLPCFLIAIALSLVSARLAMPAIAAETGLSAEGNPTTYSDGNEESVGNQPDADNGAGSPETDNASQGAGSDSQSGNNSAVDGGLSSSDASEGKSISAGNDSSVADSTSDTTGATDATDASAGTTGSSDTVVYKAVITWRSGSITAKLSGSKYKWDAENTKYILQDEQSGYSLSGKLSANVSIKVTNKSNAVIYYKIVEKDLNAAYTLTHSNGSGVSSTMIPAAGSTATAAQAGQGIDSSVYKDTVTLKATTLTEAAETVDAAEYIVTISKNPLN